MATTPEIIEKTIDYVKETMIGESSGHDWWHAYRVWQMAKRIAIAEGADLLVVELAALLHDIADYKLNGGDTTIGPNTARVFLEQIAVSPDVVDHVCDIIATTSFQGAGVPTPMATKEGAIVQDADRLDAIGAIGIARTFAYVATKAEKCMIQIFSPWRMILLMHTKTIGVRPSIIFMKNCFCSKIS